MMWIPWRRRSTWRARNHIMFTSIQCVIKQGCVILYFLLWGREGEIHNSVCLLQYKIAREGCNEVVYEVPSHGNRKRKGKPLYPSKKSTLQAIKDHNRTALAKHHVQKETAGKKGGKNNYAYRPTRGMAQPSSSDSMETASTPLYSEIYHNENLFELMFLLEGATRCKSWHLDFCHRKVIPSDVIFSHKEWWMYQFKGDWPDWKPSL